MLGLVWVRDQDCCDCNVIHVNAKVHSRALYPVCFLYLIRGLCYMNIDIIWPTVKSRCKFVFICNLYVHYAASISISPKLLIFVSTNILADGAVFSIEQHYC